LPDAEPSQLWTPPNAQSAVLYYDRDHNPPEGATIGYDASWDSCPTDLLMLLGSLRGNRLLGPEYLNLLLTPIPVNYQFIDGAAVESPGTIAPGFDFLGGSTSPPYLSKSGGYTNQANSEVCRFDQPSIDVALVANTNTDSGNPVNGENDALRVPLFQVIYDAFIMLYSPPL
jgi:hypothetical protein